MSITLTPQGSVPAIGIPNTQDYARLVFAAPYHTVIPIAEIIQPSVTEAVEAILPSLVPQYVNDAANAAVANLAVLLSGSAMTGPLFVSPTMPTQPSQVASKAYVDTMLSTAGVPEVPAVPANQIWGRMTGQWSPLPTQVNALPLTGGTMSGAINMGGNSIVNLPAVPVLPNGATPAQWVLNQIAAQSLYQGTWNPATNQPDLTQSGTHQNSFTWIASPVAAGGVVVSAPVPGLQGLTVFNGDTIIYSAMVGQFQAIHSGGLTLDEANALFVALAGSTMTGPLMLSRDPVNAMEAATREWVLANTAFPEAPNDGQAYGRNGLAHSWVPTLPIAGGVLAGALTLNGNATTSLNPVPLQQLTSTLGNYVPIAGGVSITGTLTMSGVGANLTLNSNAASALQAVPLQQLTSTLGGYLPLGGGTLTGALTIAQPTQQQLFLNSSAAGQQRLIQGQTTGNNRWTIHVGDNAAESGSNAGSNFQIARWSDAGAFLDSPISIARATGAVSIPNLTAAPGAATNVGRNLLHNGTFQVQQRGAGPWSATTLFTADRWQCFINSPDTASWSIIAATDTDKSQIGDQQIQSIMSNTFTGSTGFNVLSQRMENLRRFGGKTIIVSLWAKASSGTPRLGIGSQTNYGTGGSPSTGISANIGDTPALTSSWVRYSFSATVQSIIGQTFGTNAGSDFFQVNIWYNGGGAESGNLTGQSGTVQIWGVQLEVAQLGQTQPTSLEKIEYGDDLRHCMRFYQVGVGQLYAYQSVGSAGVSSAYSLFVPMRAAPTVAIVGQSGVANASGLSITSSGPSPYSILVYGSSVAAGLVAASVNFTASADL